MAVTQQKENLYLKYGSLFVLVLQNTSLVLFMKTAMSGDKAKFLKTISVMWAELVKLTTSIVLVILVEKNVRKGFQSIWTEFTTNWKDFLKVCVPAVVYTVQNILLYVAVDNLSPATYMVTYQLKILTTAIFTRMVLKRKLSIAQWAALFILFAGVAIVQVDQKMSDAALKEQKMLALNDSSLLATTSQSSSAELLLSTEPSAVEKAVHDIFTTIAPDNWDVNETLSRETRAIESGPREQNVVVGFCAVLAACVMSGFAGIYFEKILKGSDVSIWIRNIQLAVPSIFFAFLLACIKDGQILFEDGYSPVSVWHQMMQGFSWAVWTTVMISALGGLIVAVVIKYADNILKAFATSVAIIVNCILSYFLFDFRPTLLFIGGAAFVIGAVTVYSIYPYRAKHQPLPTSPPAEDELQIITTKTDHKA